MNRLNLIKERKVLGNEWGENNRIGENIELEILSGGEEIDIDTYEDWYICEYYLHIFCIFRYGSNVSQ